MSEQHTREIPGGWLPPVAPERKPPWWRRFGGGLLAALAFAGAKLKAILLLLPKIKVLTTSGSMLVSVGAYSLIWGWKFAVGFVVLLVVHEMGHVIALRREGVQASAPLFIPFMGALVWAKSLGGNALAEARVGLAGPVLGTIGAAMSLPQISCELIADNIHVHPAAQKILVEVKTPSGVILVTDAIRAAGLPDGDYMLDKRSVHIENGAVRLSNGTLAGSVLTMELALKNVCAASERSLAEMWITSSLNAARAIGISSRKGSLEVGKDADLVLLDESFQVQLTIVQGEIVFKE